MKIPLKNFEEYMTDRKILYRGLDYFQENHISSREDNGDGCFSFSVEGTELYTVIITLDEAQYMRSCSCDCPYDQGNLCKHEITCLFFLQQRLENEPKD
jgi:uncharacterized Zn finger protein